MTSTQRPRAWMLRLSMGTWCLVAILLLRALFLATLGLSRPRAIGSDCASTGSSPPSTRDACAAPRSSTPTRSSSVTSSAAVAPSATTRAASAARGGWTRRGPCSLDKVAAALVERETLTLEVEEISGARIFDPVPGARARTSWGA